MQWQCCNIDCTPGACFKPMGNMSYEEASMLPWGKYSLVVSGQDSNMTTRYCRKYQIFVSIGVATPTYNLVVPAATACP